jgi:cytochrome c
VQIGRSIAIENTMSERLFAAAITTLMLLWSAESVSAQQLGTAEEARAMLDRAISALKSNEATALSEFNDPNNKQFHDRDLYVFCYNMSNGKITAYESPALLNVDVRTLALKDDPIGQRAYETVQNSPEGSVTAIDYNFPKPGTNEPVPKQTLETRIGNLGCGAHTTNSRRPTALL